MCGRCGSQARQAITEDGITSTGWPIVSKILKTFVPNRWHGANSDCDDREQTKAVDYSGN